MDDDKNISDLSVRLLEESDLLKQTVTGDEIWVFQYDPKTNCQSLQRESPDAPETGTRSSGKN
jgi:hypothetical protein